MASGRWRRSAMLTPGTSVGRYIVQRKLAEGGMAEIYLASAHGPEGFAKDVALKVVRDFLASDQQFIDMFISEARLASRLNHANIVQIFDFGKHGDSYYLAMEFVRGASLWDLRRRCRELGVPFPPLLAAEIGSQVARGLHYAHALSDRGLPIGLVHRDVTPHNVLLSFDGAVKLTDFGIAKASATHTAPGMLKGKFAYMAPEQARGERVDLRTDIFALGIVLWELLTGGRLFDADTEVAILNAVQTSAIAPPHRLNPEVPLELSNVVMRALARPLRERLASAFDLERALAMFVLKHASSVEDTSVALFLQQMFREEYTSEYAIAGPPPGPGAAPAPPSSAPTATPVERNDLGIADTARVDRPRQGGAAPMTSTATPAPHPVPPLDISISPTDEHTSSRALRPRTEQMPGLPLPARPSGEPLDTGPGTQLAQPMAKRALPLSSSAAPPRALEEPSVSVSKTERNEPRVRLRLVLGALCTAGVLGAAGWWYWRPMAWGELRAQPGALVGDPPAEGSAPTGVAAEPAAVDSPVNATADANDWAPPAIDPDLASPVAENPIDAGVAPNPARASVVRPQVAHASAGERSAKHATLEVKAIPYANVYVGGRFLGEVEGIKHFKLKSGRYTVTLEHPRSKRDVPVTLVAGQRTQVSFEVPGN